MENKTVEKTADEDEKVKVVIYEAPLEFEMKKIRQDGLVEMNFNQDLQVPDLTSI